MGHGFQCIVGSGSAGFGFYFDCSLWSVGYFRCQGWVGSGWGELQILSSAHTIDKDFLVVARRRGSC